MTLSRRVFIVSGAIAAAGARVASATTPVAGDMSLGPRDARVHLIEYASLTCGGCAAFHAHVFPRLKSSYIDTGRIGFTFREYPTPPAPVAFAMFQLARAGQADAATYFDRVAILFTRQPQILGPGTAAAARDVMIAIGAEWGLSAEQVLNTIQDPAGAARVQATVTDGRDRYGVTRTPSLILNEGLLTGPPTYEALAAELDRALAT